jgi:hypothetical protein
MHRYALRDDQWDKIKDFLRRLHNHPASDPRRDRSR